MADVVFESHTLSDVSWYSKPIENGTAKDNFDRIIQLRKEFCHPLTIRPDGQLNEEYFCAAEKETAMKWTDIETLQLYNGIFKFGVDSVEKWIAIKDAFLPQRDFIEVRLKLTQMLGVQDLSIYKDRKFSSEKEIKDEFNKNKAKGIEDGTWTDLGDVALKPEVAKLSEDDIKSMENEELRLWNEHVYNNPTFIYRPNTKKGQAPGKKTTNKRKPTKKAKQTENTKKEAKKPTMIDDLIKKKKDETAVTETNTTESTEKPTKETEVTEPQKTQEEETKPKAKETKSTKKTSKKKKSAKGVPLLPESSDDEEMLCVE